MIDLNKKLGKYFTLKEFCTSETAKKHNISMIPSDEIVNNLESLVVEILDPLRQYLNEAVLITSGWRPPKLNAMIGGVPNSDHLTGTTADVSLVNKANNLKILSAILTLKKEKKIKGFKQLILEGVPPVWCHIANGKGNQILQTEDFKTYTLINQGEKNV